MRTNETVTGVCDDTRSGARRGASPSIIVEDGLLGFLDDEDPLPSIVVDRKGLLPSRRIRAKTIK